MDDTLAIESKEDPLTQIENSLCDTINELNQNIRMRQTYEIMMIKCEYVDEFATVLEQIINNCSGITEKIQLAYERAKALDILTPNLTPQALGTRYAFIF